jgi:hypothetical protein
MSERGVCVAKEKNNEMGSLLADSEMGEVPLGF